MAKKVLLISYYFPPNAEVGGLRIANFARRLPRFGWEPYVLTLKDEYIEKTDTENRSYVEGIKIVKAGRLPTLSDGYLGIKRAVQSLLRKPTDPKAERPPSPSRSGTSTPSETVAGRLRRYILSFLTLPDPQRNWMWPTVIKAVCLIRREKIDAIVTSCPPYSAHLVGWVVKEITGVRWIADFRDPWMTTPSKSLYYTCAASRRIERWFERGVVGKADLVVANTPKLRDAFGAAYGACPDERFVCLTNGFDGEFFSRFENAEKENPFTIIYTGTLYFGRTPEPVFQAVHELIGEGRIAPGDIRVRLVGHCQSIGGRPIESVIETYRLSGVVDVRGPVSYVKAIEMVKRSHLALLLAPNQPYQIPAKAYDYMGMGTKVLALAGEGATSDLIRSTGIGGVFHPGDVAGIKSFIAQSFQANADGAASLRNEAVERFDIGFITLTLADHLDRIGIKAEEKREASKGSYHTARPG